MEKEKIYLTAADVAQIMGVSQSTAYRIISQLNGELQKQGYIVARGKVSARYFNERVYK